MDEKCHFVFFGFLRSMTHPKNLPPQSKKYLYAPLQKYEDKDDEVTPEDLQLIAPHNLTHYHLWNYDKRIFLKKWENYPNIPPFNQFYQQPYRILSFFYHLKMSLSLLQPKDIKDDDLIFLLRVDNDVQKIHYDPINYVLNHPSAPADLIIDSYNGPQGIKDHYFIFKKPIIPIFQSLYDSYLDYCLQYYQSPQESQFPSTRPEDIFYHHFITVHKLKVQAAPNIIEMGFTHVCNKYCGHHGPYTAT
jgi:hypothetical protein